MLLRPAIFPSDVVAQPLEQLPAPFDNPEWLFELKYDGFRGLAFVDDGVAKLVSRNDRPFTRFPKLARELGAALGAHAAILDGEITCVDAGGAPTFRRLLSRGADPLFFAFDLLWLDGEDLRPLPIVQRKRRLRRLLGKGKGPVRYVEPIAGRGCALFAEACARDLEGIVAKWTLAPYGVVGRRSSWVKVKNPEYSQARDRAELFAR